MPIDYHLSFNEETLRNNKLEKYTSLTTVDFESSLKLKMNIGKTEPI